MIKTFLNHTFALLVLTLSIHTTIEAQVAEGKVVYQFITNLRGIELPRVATLYLNKERSVFYHSKGDFKMIARDYLGNDFDPTKTITSTGDNSGKQLIDGYMQDSVGNVYFKDFKKKELIMREIIAIVPYLTEEPQLPQFKWKILKEQKDIGKFKCQKATTDFRGRTYIAWFALGINISNGPWKLHGLPGLILEAYDKTGEVKFLFSSITIPCTDEFLINAPVSGKKASFEDWKKADIVENEKIMQRELSKKDRDPNSKHEVKKQNTIEKEYEK